MTKIKKNKETDTLAVSWYSKKNTTNNKKNTIQLNKQIQNKYQRRKRNRDKAKT